MLLILDTADLDEIRQLNEILCVDGVTTNPTIITREGRDYHEVLKDISSILHEDQKLFVQVIAATAEKMVEEGRRIAAFRKNTYVKVPVSEEGLKAIKILHEEGVGVLATAIHSATQGFLAAKNGADYLAPYVNRMNDYTDGVEETISMHTILRNYGMKTEIVAASFHHVDQVKRLLEAGIEAVTLPPAICRAMYEHEGTEKSVRRFSEDWLTAYGKESIEL